LTVDFRYKYVYEKHLNVKSIIGNT